MLTPSEIKRTTFDRYMGKGYRAEDVDAFLKEVAADFTTLIDEKEDLEKKLEVLADKLEEYRQDEDSLRAALLGAQKLGDSVIKDAKTKADIIMRDATIKAETMVSNAQSKIEREEVALAKMKHEVAQFREKLIELYRQHIELIQALPSEDPLETKATPAPAAEQAAPAPQEKGPEPVQEPVLEQPLDLPLAKEPDAPVGEAEGKSEDPYQEPVIESSRFGPLKFGQNYQIRGDEMRK